MFANRGRGGRARTFFKFASTGLKLLRQSYAARYFLSPETRVPVSLHWLTFGVWKGYKLFPPFTPVIEGSTVGLRFSAASIQSPKLANSRNSLLRPIANEIIRQANFEPALLAPGLDALTNLRVINSNDLESRTGFETGTLKGQIKVRPTSVVVLPHIVRGGADKYASNLIEMLLDLQHGPVLTILTLPHATFDKNSELALEMPGFTKSDVVFWRDIATHGQGEVFNLAKLLNALSPRNVFILNSQIGLETLSKFGQSLSTKMALFVAYFSMDQSAFAGQYGVRFPRRLGKQTDSFSDNEKAAKRLDELYLSDFGKKALVIPSVIKTIDAQEFNMRVEKNLKLRSLPRPQKKWLWISRLDKFKGTNLLGLLAAARPNDLFDVFGPMQNESLSQLGLAKSNIRYKGELPSVELADFSDYEGFLFTSDFEGLPLIVLEMTQHALPIISTKVGSLGITFDDSEIYFVDSEGDYAKKAGEFLKLMEKLEKASTHEVRARLEDAATKVVEEHSMKAVRDKVAELLND